MTALTRRPDAHLEYANSLHHSLKSKTHRARSSGKPQSSVARGANSDKRGRAIKSDGLSKGNGDQIHCISVMMH